jgi:hypothetical protein
VAERAMPNLKSRLELDTSDVRRAHADVDALKRTVASTENDVRVATDISKVTTSATDSSAALDSLEASSRSATSGVADAAVVAASAAGDLDGLSEGAGEAVGGLATLGVAAGTAMEALAGLRAGQAAAAGSTASLASSLGTGNLVMAGVGVAAAALTVGMQLFGSGSEDAREKVEALNKALGDQIGALDLTKEAFDAYLLTTEDAFFTPEQLSQLQQAGIYTDDLRDSVEGVSSSLDDYIAGLIEAGEITDVTARVTKISGDVQRDYVVSTDGLVEVNGRWYDGNVDLIESQRDLIDETSELAEKKANELVQTNAITQARLDELVATNQLADGTTNWVAVSETASAQAAVAANVENLLTNAVDNAVESVKEYARAKREQAQAQVDAVNASLAADSSLLGSQRAFTSALAQVDEAMSRGTKTRVAVAESAEAAARRQAQAERQVEDATRGVSDARERLADSEAKVADARARLDEVANVTIAKEQAAAARELELASRGVADAQERAADARRKLDETLAGPTQRDVAKADRDRRAALQQVEQAERALADARRARDRSLLSANPRRRAEAERELEEATLALERAQQTAADATEHHDQLAGFSADTSDDVAEARKALERAERDVADAQQRAADTQDKLTEKLGPNLDGSKLLEQARRDLAKAEEEVRDRTQDVTDRVRDLADAQENRLTPTTSGAVQPVRDLDAALDDAADAALALSQNAVDAAVANATLRGETVTAAEQARIQRDKLIELQGTLAPDSPLRAHLQGYIDRLGVIPGVLDTELTVDTTKANEALNEFEQRVQDAVDRGFDPNQRARDFYPSAGVQRRHTGGSVTAGVPYIVRPDEVLVVPDISGRMADAASVLAPAASGGVTVGEGAIVQQFSVGANVDEFDLRRVRRVAEEATYEALDSVLAGARS